MTTKDELKGIIETFNKKHGREIIFLGSQMKKISFIPFSSPKANWLTRGGIARNRLSEFVGAEESGKTTSSLDIVKNFQQISNRAVLFVDAENSIDFEWATLLGVDIDRVIWIKPDDEYAEQVLQMVIDMVKSGKIGLVVIDSIPYLVPKAVYEGDMEAQSYCGNAGVLTKFAQKITGILTKYECTMIMINQLRDKIGTPYTAYNTPGGRALKHAYSQRLFFSKGKFIDESCNELVNSTDLAYGNIVDIRIMKNKVTKPDRRLGSYTLTYSDGIHVINDTIQAGLLTGVILQSGAWFSIVDKSTGEILSEAGGVLKFQGKAKLIKKLEEDEELFNTVYEMVNEEVTK